MPVRKLNIFFKAIPISLLCLFGLTSFSQVEKNMISFSNLLLINPSFAGLNGYNRVWSGYQFNTISKEQAFSEFSFTFDDYSQKLKGGYAIYIQQGLFGEVNTTTTEFGFAVSKHYGNDEHLFIPSLNINLQFASKQWYVDFIDQMMNKKIEPPSPPGEHAARYYKLKPRIGFLWDSRIYRVSFSALFPAGKHLANEGVRPDLNSPVVVLYVSQKMRGKQKGLTSRPFKATPRLTLLYSENIVLSRFGFFVEHVDHTFLLFVQNNFTENYHAAGGTLGWKYNNLKLNLTAGIGLPFVSKKTIFFGEVTLGLEIPPFYHSEKYPWQPQKKYF